MSDKRVLVLVHWVDSSSCPGVWTAIEEINYELSYCESIGWIMFEDDELMTISSHQTANQVSGVMTIPKCAIEQIWEITM